MQCGSIILNEIIHIRDETIIRQSSHLDLSAESRNKWFRCKKGFHQTIGQEKSIAV